MPAVPIQLQIVEAIRTRLATITTAGGFHTDAGANVHLGRIVDDEHDPLPALVVWLHQPSTVHDGSIGSHLRRELVVVVEGIVEQQDLDPLADTLRLADDIKRAVYQPSALRLVDGAQDIKIVQDEHFPAEPGSRSATAQITFNVPFVERMGA